MAAAALVALAVFVPPAGTEPAQAQTAEVEHWSATLTVGNLPPNAWRGYSSSLNKGMLSDNDFVYEGVTYVVTNLTDRGNGDVLLELNKPIPASMKAAVTLRIRALELPLSDATAPNANTLRWEDTGFRFSLDDTPNVKLITPATTAPPPPPVDLSGTRTVWHATLTVGDASPDVGFVSSISVGTLSNSNFTYAGVNYVIRQLIVAHEGHLTFRFDRNPNSLKSSALTLNVGNSLSDLRQFALVDSEVTGNRLRWSNSGLSWSEGDTVRLWLTVDLSALNLPTLTASISGDPVEDWETNSAHDLWSPTLTVKDLDTTPASAPANRGCDDSDSSARCSSALTDNDFTFKGVAYTVKAISYNQRKVAADTSTFQVTTYPERLKLTLDKTIPESLQSCLALYAGNARIPFADDGVAGAGVDSVLSRSTTNDVANDTLTLTEISGNAWGLNWSTGQTVQLRLPSVGCLTLTLSEPVTETTSMQRRRGGTTDPYRPHPTPSIQGVDNRQPGTFGDYQYFKIPTFAAGSTSASTPIKPVDDNAVEGCETIILVMTMWPGTYRAVHTSDTIYIEDDDGGTPCVVLKAQDGVSGLRVTEAPTDYVVPGYTKPDGSPGTAGDDDAGSLPPDPANNAPTVAAPLADLIEPVVGGGREIDLSGVFADADGDALTYSASTTNEDISVGYIDGARMLVLALSRGTVTITVTADDGNGGAVSDSFTVTVKEAPTVASPIADISGLEAGASQQVSLSGVFADADGDALTLSAASSDTAVATVASNSASLTVRGVSAGTATITVTARDADGNTVSDSFTVTVKTAPPPATAPTLARPIADISELEAGASQQVSLSGVFADADGDVLTHSSSSSDTAVATATVGNGNLTVTAHQAGTASITVTAQDPDGNQVSNTFNVTVIARPEPEVEAPTSEPEPEQEQDVVARYDANGDGVISRSEYYAAVADIGKGVTYADLVRIRQAWADGGYQ